MAGVGFTTDWAYLCFCHSCFLKADVEGLIKVVFVKPEGLVTVKAPEIPVYATRRKARDHV